ncbi:MAG: trigger factor [Oscillospiraceae bacterium]|nr:trigger factor [Oscillospiraceae bacterium]
MKIKSCEIGEKNTAEIVVEAEPDEFDSAMNESFKKSRNSMTVPGFRRGKAPRKIVEKMYGVSIFYNDALDVLLPQAVSFAIKESELRIVGSPTFNDVDFKDDERSVDITLTVAVYPDVTIGEYKGVSAIKPLVFVDDIEVESEIEVVRLRNARIETVDRPANDGDTVVIDYEGFVDGEPFAGGKSENFELELGSDTFIPGFEEKIVGMAAGDERDLDLVFPENYSVRLAGKPVLFKVKLNEVRERILPELDDDFAMDVSEYDTYEEYKTSIREDIQKERQVEADSVFENALINKILLSLEADVPDAMVDEQFDITMGNFADQVSAYGMEPAAYLRMMNTTPDEFQGRMRAQSERQVRVMLALDKIAELESVEITEEEIENEYAEAAARYEKEVEKLKESVDSKNIERELKMRRAAKIVVENAIVDTPPEEAATPAEDSDD